MHIFEGTPDLSDNSPQFFFCQWTVLFQYCGQVIMHRRLVEDVDEIFVTEYMIESNDVGM
jgi:hypothetical protein